ncbi:MAG: helix-turn-helix domain-containing protein [Verrucomicrobiota bacterium]
MDLREVRKKLGWSATDTAYFFGVSVSSVYKWEQGRYRNGYPDAVRLLGVILACYGRRRAQMALAGLAPDGTHCPWLVPKQLARVHQHVYTALA